jgi:hypothetical protein
MSSENFRFFVLTCRDPKSDFRQPLVAALRRHYPTYYIWLRRRPVVSGPGTNEGATEMSLLNFLRFMRRFRQDNCINIYFNSLNTYFPGLTAILRVIATAGVWCLDMHDDLRYHNLGFKRWREGMIIAFLRRLSHVTVHAATTLQEQFPDAQHLGNASSIQPLCLPDLNSNDILIIASFDPRFDFDFLAELAEKCPTNRFHLHGWTHPKDPASMTRILAATARYSNVYYHGPYTMADLPAILSRYRISVAPYRADSMLTRYIDPLRFYHCLNAGLEVITTNIPQARQMADWLHVVSDATACADTLAAIQAGRLAKQPAYSPITWEQRADRLVEILRSLPRTVKLRRRRRAAQ